MVRAGSWGWLYARPVPYALSPLILTNSWGHRGGNYDQAFNWTQGWIPIPMASPADSVYPTSALWPAVPSGCPALCGPHPMFAEITPHLLTVWEPIGLGVPNCFICHLLLRAGLLVLGDLAWPLCVQASRVTCHSVPASIGNISCLFCTKNMAQCRLRSRIIEYHC